MDLSLSITAALLGLGGAWHCTLMCGSLCALRPDRWLLLGRVMGYALAGAAVASAARWGGHWVFQAHKAATSPGLMFWALAHAAVCAWGLWMAVTGRQPAGLAWRPASRANPTDGATIRVVSEPGLLARRTVVRPVLTGMAWVALPCGLLQSALLVAALGSGAVGGAAAMAAFALTSSMGLVAAPAAWGLARRHGGGSRWQSRLTRLSGALMAAASAWAMGHGVWAQIRDYC